MMPVVTEHGIPLEVAGHIDPFVLEKRCIVHSPPNWMNIRYFWAEAEVFLYRKFREGNHPTGLYILLEAARQYAGWSQYGTGFLESCMMMLVKLNTRGKLFWLCEYEEWNWMVNGGHADLLLLYQYRMETRFADIEEFRLFARDDSFQKRLDESDPLDRVSQQTITLMLEKVNRDIATRRELLGLPKLVDVKDTETLEIRYTEDQAKRSVGSSEEYNSDESIYQLTPQPSPISSVCSSIFVPGTPRPPADPFVDSPKIVSPMAKSPAGEWDADPKCPVVYTLAAPPPASGLWDRRATRKRKALCNDLSPTLRIHTNPRFGCSGILDGVVESPKGPPPVPRKCWRPRLCYEMNFAKVDCF